MTRKAINQMAFPITLTKEGFNQFLKMAIRSAVEVFEERHPVFLKSEQKTKKNRKGA